VIEFVRVVEAAAGALVDGVVVCPAACVVDACCAADVCWVADVWAGCCCVVEEATGVLLVAAACGDEEAAGVADVAGAAAAADEESTEAEAWRGNNTFRACGRRDRLSTRSLANTRADV
jgi:hypothetical protein